jgi:hypothetical protein
MTMFMCVMLTLLLTSEYGVQGKPLNAEKIVELRLNSCVGFPLLLPRSCLITKFKFIEVALFDCLCVN